MGVSVVPLTTRWVVVRPRYRARVSVWVCLCVFVVCETAMGTVLSRNKPVTVIAAIVVTTTPIRAMREGAVDDDQVCALAEGTFTRISPDSSAISAELSISL